MAGEGQSPRSAGVLEPKLADHDVRLAVAVEIDHTQAFAALRQADGAFLPGRERHLPPEVQDIAGPSLVARDYVELAVAVKISDLDVVQVSTVEDCMRRPGGATILEPGDPT